jgi:carnitine O-acetyltransferase
VVLANDRYYKVDTEGRSASQLSEAFKQVKEMAKGQSGSGLGILCADDRDVWTEVGTCI